MKILLAGANGYIGTRLINPLLDEGHQLFALVRRPIDFEILEKNLANFQMIQGDLLLKESLTKIPKDLDAAYYLVHSMTNTEEDFAALEEKCALNFIEAIKRTSIKQVIFLSGISNDAALSPHLSSRKTVESIIINSGIPFTILKCAVIIGSGSASFEIIRDLAEKLPVMVTPKWVNNKTQPIGIADILFYLKAVLANPKALDRIFEIGGPDQLTYKEMLERYAKIRGLRRYIINVPVLTPRLSSYWLYFVTSTNFALASTLVESMRNQTICKDFAIKEVIPHECLTYDDSVRKALAKIEQNHVLSSWRDAMVRSSLNPNLQEYIQVPTFGCFTETRIVHSSDSIDKILDKIWSLGGSNGWLFADWAWSFRGFIDKLFGGVGLNRGRTHPHRIVMGDVIDFWRVLVADRKKGRLLLYAEMKIPGEAWLEFKVEPHGEKGILTQTATFRPKGVSGRLYWYALLPIHKLIFGGMAKALSTGKG